MNVLDSILYPANQSWKFIRPYITGYTIILFLSIILYFIWLRKSYLSKQKISPETFENGLIDEENADETIGETDKKTAKINKKPNKNQNIKKKVKFVDTISRSGKDDKKYDKKYDERDELDSDENDRNHSKRKIKGRSTNSVENFAEVASQLNQQSSNSIFPEFKKANITPELEMKFNNLFTDKLKSLSAYISNIKVTSGIPADGVNINNITGKYLSAFNTKLNLEVGKLMNLLKKDIKYFNVKLSDDEIKNKLIELIYSNIHDKIRTTNTEIDKYNKQLVDNSGNNSIASKGIIMVVKTFKEDVANFQYALQILNIQYVKLDRLHDGSMIQLSTMSSSSSDPEIVLKETPKGLQPDYESKIDRNMVNVSKYYDGDENKLASEYSKKYNAYLEKKNIDDMKIDPINIGEQLENSIINIVSGKAFSGDNKNKKPNIIENYKGNQNLIPDGEFSKYYIGDYLADRKVQKNMIEGFEDEIAPSDGGTKILPVDGQIKKLPVVNKTQTNLSTNNSNTNDLIADVSNYVLETGTDLLKKYGNDITDNISSVTKSITGTNDNMISGGILLIILSMLLYMIDITS
jgi:hypothetical protein